VDPGPLSTMPRSVVRCPHTVNVAMSSLGVQGLTSVPRLLPVQTSVYHAQFQKTVDEGIYFPVDCNALREDGVRNELPVYLLSSLPVLKKQQQTNLDQAEMPSSLFEAVPIK